MSTRARCLALTAGVLIAGAWEAAEPHGQDKIPRFTLGAYLSGAQEVVPPNAPTTPSLGVETDMSARVVVVFGRDLTDFRFRLNVQNGVKVTQAHLHCGRPGENGPVVVFLSALNAGGADINGLLGQGTRRNQDVEPGAAACEELIGRPVRNIASLAAAAAAGLIYANVHTVANPAGEVRGQLILEGSHNDSSDEGY
jgi:hypothetical protein